MAFEGLSDRLESAFKRLRSKGSLNESDVREAMREVRLALLEADVNYKVAKDFTAKVTERAIGSRGYGESYALADGYQNRQRGIDGADGRYADKTCLRFPSAYGCDDVRPTGLR